MDIKLFGMVIAAIFTKTVLADNIQRRVIIGQTVVLPCSIDGGGDANVQWLNTRNLSITNNKDVTNGQDRYSVESRLKNDRNLRITGVRSDDSGTYQCRISGSEVKMKFVDLIVDVPPNILNNSRDQEVEVGTEIRLECFATGTPQPTITWFRLTGDGERINLNAKGNVYTVESVDVQSAGVYQCYVDNGVKPAVESDMRIHVLFAPTVNAPYREVSQQKGRAAMMTCIVNANPIDQVFWLRDGVQFDNSNKWRMSEWSLGDYQRMYTATVSDLDTADYGVYECVAQNRFGQDSDRINLHAYQKDHTRVLEAPADTISLLNSRVVLKCSVVGVSSINSVIWSFDDGLTRQQLFEAVGGAEGSFITTDSDKYEVVGYYNLVIKSATFEDAGKYICEVTGLKNYSAELTVLGHVMCDDERLIVDNDQKVNSGCTVLHAGPRDAGWRVDWTRGDTGERVSSISDYGVRRSNRVMSFSASYPQSNGEYTCAVTNKRPFYVDNCTTQITVLPEKKAGNLSASCGGETSDSKPVQPNGASSTVLFLSLLLTVVLIGFIVLLATVVTYYRRQLAFIHHDASETISLKKTNGTSSSSPIKV